MLETALWSFVPKTRNLEPVFGRSDYGGVAWHAAGLTLKRPLAYMTLDLAPTSEEENSGGGALVFVIPDLAPVFKRTT